MIILAHAGTKDEFPKETEDFREVVALLLQVRISEELHRRSLRMSVAALVVSIAVAVMMAVQIWSHVHGSCAAKPQSQVAISPLPAPAGQTSKP